jgi:hypothetical protein
VPQHLLHADQADLAVQAARRFNTTLK